LIRLIKAELKKLVHKKSFLIITVIFIAFCFLTNIIYKENYEDTLKKILSIVMTTFVMVIVLLFLQRIFPYQSTSRVFSIFYVTCYSILGIVIYFAIAFQSKLIYGIFGRENIKQIMKRFKR